jgi:lipopolysaccharide/colanic/teichoic acid biosynthesis glycosyltransferase
VQHQLLRHSSQLKKRIVDIALSVVFGVIALPAIAIISLLIRLDSPGTVFYRQERMGRGNKRFTIIKFRSMYCDAHDRLQHLLEQSEELRAEYEIFHKLRNDPRVTRIGRFLRKYSLDELPQFWNILKGDMSLIGPRAYGPWEKGDMQGYDEILLKVVPGLTGLWQVTGRNDIGSSFESRMRTDDYYICNWSMFMDAYIVARTFAVIFFGRGR